MQGLSWSLLQMPLASGLNSKPDARALNSPELAVCKDIQFDDWAGLQTRYPYLASTLTADIFGGGTLSDCRRIYVNGDELLVFTSTALYSWNAQLAKWVSKGTHLAVAVDEDPVFVAPGDQYNCDRAELSGTIVYAWYDSTVYVAALDKTTGSVLMSPTSIATSQTPRLVACSTKILLVCIKSGALVAYSIDPAAPATAIAGAPTTILASPGSAFDVVRSLGTATSALVASQRTPNTSYEVMRVAEAGTVSATSTKARTCDGAISVCDASTGEVQVCRANSNNIQGDQLTSALVDTYTGQAVGAGLSATINQIASCFASTTCRVFWTSSQTASGGTYFNTKTNTVTLANSVGSSSTFISRLGLASRAFLYNSEVYAVFAFAGTSEFTTVASLAPNYRSQLQNALFLYRADGFLVAKMAAGRAGGFPDSRFLPGVALTSGSTAFSFAATERRIIPLGENQYGYSDRGPRDITFTFDSSDARRCARLGQTLYISGGEILQYDGLRVTEVGFHIYPWYMAAAESSAGTGTITTNGNYAFKGTYRWDNAKGERDRSTTATVGAAAIAGQPSDFTISNAVPLHVTHKTTNPPSVEWWRTVVSPTADTPFYLITGQDPATTTGDNCYIANDTSLTVLADFVDGMTDASLVTKESHPENGDLLENLAPPPASIVLASDTRLFLAGVAGEPNNVWYSKQRGESEVAAFHDVLRVAVPERGGLITGLAFLNETLIVFRETAIYALDGQGYDNAGNGQNYSPRLLSSDCGAVNHESIALTDKGLIFKSNKGWYILNRGWALDYIGAQVADYDSDTVVAVHVLENQHQIRCLTTSRMLVLDTNVGQWSEWTISDGLHACIWDGQHTYLATASVKKQSTSYSSLTYGWDIETAWIKLNDLQGAGRVRKILLLGEYRSAHHIRVRVSYNYDTTVVDDKYWTVSPTTVGGPLQFEHGPKYPQCEAIKIRLTAVDTTHATVPSGEASKLTALAFDVGIKPNGWRLPAAQKQ